MRKSPLWIEVWIETNDYQRLLVLNCFEGDKIELSDPQNSGTVLEVFSTYDEASIWLTDEEYSWVGRISLED